MLGQCGRWNGVLHKQIRILIMRGLVDESRRVRHEELEGPRLIALSSTEIE